MKNFVDYIKEFYSHNPDKEKILETIEFMYFRFISRPIKLLSIFSQEYKIARDVILIKHKILKDNNIFNIRLKSKILKENLILKDFKMKKTLENSDIDMIYRDIIKVYYFYVSAVFIVIDILNEREIEIVKWIIAVIIGFVLSIFFK